MLQINEQLKAIRIKKGLTQQQLSELSNVNRAYISRIESKRVYPSALIIEKLVNGLNASIIIE